MSTADYIGGKSIIITGAASGFGKLISEKAAAAGAKVICADINESALQETVAQIIDNGGEALGVVVNVTDTDEMFSLAQRATETYGAVDVMINNAGVMPLAFFSDHQAAMQRWHQCIDINIKGVLNGMSAVYDQMIKQGHGHVINISSIYGNFPVAGAAVYGASKAAVNFLSESLRVESQGKIKVTRVKPTGVPTTGIGSAVVNVEAAVGVVGQNAQNYFETLQAMGEGVIDPEKLDAEEIAYAVLEPEHLADQVIHVSNQPLGVNISEICVRASGDHYVI